MSKPYQDAAAPSLWRLPEREATVVSLHPVLEEVLEKYRVSLAVPKDLSRTPLPNSEEVRLLREEIDSKSIYLDASV